MTPARFSALGNIILIDEALDARAWDAWTSPHAADRARAECLGATPADQLLAIRHQGQGTWRVRVFNADGSRAGMCGNGARCVVRHALETRGEREVVIEFEDGSGLVGRRVQGRTVDADPFLGEIDMGPPTFDPASIPVDAASVIGHDAGVARVALRGEAFEEPLRACGAEAWVHAVGVGNPHAILWCSIVSDTLVQSVGPLVQAMGLFPEDVNVHLAWVEAGGMRLESFERGSGYTRACASGACAAVAAGVASGRLGSGATVDMAGGVLDVKWHAGHGVVMRGAAERA